jgi:PAS domain S-box-containing protein
MQMSGKPLHLIADAFSGIAFVADRTGQLRHLSPRFYEFTGLSRQTPPADAMRHAIHPIDRSRVLARWEISVEAGSPFRSIFRIKRRDGCSRWFWALGRLLGATGEAQWLGVCLFMDDLGALQMVAEPGGEAADRAADRFEIGLDLSPWATQDKRPAADATRDIREKLTVAATFAAASARLLEAGGVDAMDKASEMLNRISEELVSAGRLIHDSGDAGAAPPGGRSILDG